MDYATIMKKHGEFLFPSVINYHAEYITDGAGHRLTFRLAREGLPHREDGLGRTFEVDEDGGLVRDSHGVPFRQWRKPKRCRSGDRFLLMYMIRTVTTSSVKPSFMMHVPSECRNVRMTATR